MKGEIRQAPSEIADWNLEMSIDSLASVGMLAKKAERFRRREDGDGGSSGAPEPSSQRKRLRICAPERRDEREHRGRRRAGEERGAVADGSERWSRRH
jgi:hypothetical protein